MKIHGHSVFPIVTPLTKKAISNSFGCETEESKDEIILLFLNVSRVWWFWETRGKGSKFWAFVAVMASSSLTYYTQRSRPFYGDGISREISWQKERMVNKRVSWQLNKCLPGDWAVEFGGWDQQEIAKHQFSTKAQTQTPGASARPPSRPLGGTQRPDGERPWAEGVESASGFCWEHFVLFSSLLVLFFIDFFPSYLSS